MNIYGRTGIPQLPTKEERGGCLLAMFDVIYPTAPGVHLNGGGGCDAVTLTESCYQLDSSEHEWLRKLLSGSE